MQVRKSKSPHNTEIVQNRNLGFGAVRIGPSADLAGNVGSSTPTPTGISIPSTTPAQTEICWTTPMTMEAHVLKLRPTSATETDPALSSPCPKLLPPTPLSHVTFRHPGYPDLSNILFRMPAYDGCELDGDRAGSGWGVHHGTALWACSIIASNIDGFLHPARLQSPPDGSLPVEDSVDALLMGNVYYFYPRAWTSSPDQADLQYAVCPSFQDWRFPMIRPPTYGRMSIYVLHLHLLVPNTEYF